jgi:hypothetical protein
MFRAFCIICCFIASWFVLSCRTNKDSLTEKNSQFDAVNFFSNYEFKTADENVSVIATLQRTPCYGTCPIFQISVFKNGLTFYNGEENVLQKGKFYFYLNQEDINSIFDKAKEINYFTLENNYDMPVSDFPTTISSLSDQKNVKKIENRAGGPKELAEFESFFEKLILSKSMIKIDIK